MPYVGLSAGPNLAVEDFSNNEGGSNWSSGSKMHGGAGIWCGLKTPVSKKFDLDVSCRYSRINASENIETLGIYIGLGIRTSFAAKQKNNNNLLLFQEKKNK